MSIRRTASWAQPRQLNSLPRGARSGARVVTATSLRGILRRTRAVGRDGLRARRERGGNRDDAAGRMDEDQDYYEILQVHPGASQEVIRAAYRALAQRYHPDNAGPDGEATMVVINGAYEVLGDSDRRAQYDRDRGIRAPDGGAGSEGSASGGSAGAATPTGTAFTGHAPSGEWWEGSAGPPPGRPSGSVLQFGRHKGWSIGEITRYDPGYLEWLERKPEGRPYLDEIDDTLFKFGFRHERLRRAR